MGGADRQLNAHKLSKGWKKAASRHAMTSNYWKISHTRSFLAQVTKPRRLRPVSFVALCLRVRKQIQIFFQPPLEKPGQTVFAFSFAASRKFQCLETIRVDRCSSVVNFPTLGSFRVFPAHSESSPYLLCWNLQVGRHLRRSRLPLFQCLEKTRLLRREAL